MTVRTRLNNVMNNPENIEEHHKERIKLKLNKLIVDEAHSWVIEQSYNVNDGVDVARGIYAVLPRWKKAMQEVLADFREEELQEAMNRRTALNTPW